MTHEELIAIAREQAKGFSGVNEFPVTLDMLPKVRVLDAVAVYFESDQHNGQIEVFLEKESGKCIGATLIPSKPKPNTPA